MNPWDYSVLQDEILATEEAVWLPYLTTDITTNTNSQPALGAFKSKTIRLKVVINYREVLLWLHACKVKICWVPGYGDVERNQLTDPARRGKEHRNIIEEKVRTEHDKRRCKMNDCTIWRSLWLKLDKLRTSRMLIFKKSWVRKAKVPTRRGRKVYRKVLRTSSRGRYVWEYRERGG